MAGEICVYCEMNPARKGNHGQVSLSCSWKECVKQNKRTANNLYIRKQKAKGLVHRTDLNGKQRWMTISEFDAIKASRPKRKGQPKRKNYRCLVPGCESRAHCKDLCHTHYELQRAGDPNWNRLKKFRRRPGETLAVTRKVYCRPTRQVETALGKACEEMGTNIHHLLNEILTLWERQYRAGGYVAALSPGNIVDPQAFYSTKRHLRT